MSADRRTLSRKSSPARTCFSPGAIFLRGDRIFLHRIVTDGRTVILLWQHIALICISWRSLIKISGWMRLRTTTDRQETWLFWRTVLWANSKTPHDLFYSRRVTDIEGARSSLSSSPVYTLTIFLVFFEESPMLWQSLFSIPNASSNPNQSAQMLHN